MTWVCPDRGVKDQHMPSIIDIRWNILWDLQQTHILVGGFNPSETYWSVGMIVPNIWRKKHQPAYIMIGGFVQKLWGIPGVTRYVPVYCNFHAGKWWYPTGFGVPATVCFSGWTYRGYRKSSVTIYPWKWNSLVRNSEDSFLYLFHSASVHHTGS